MHIKLYFPRWFFPNNLGDTLVFTFIPKILKQVYNQCTLEIISHGFVLDLLKLDTNVDIAREPHLNEINLDYRGYAFSDTKHENIKVIYPDWHPKVFNFWKENSEFLENHPTANLITVNYLLQLQLEHLLFSGVDLLYYANVKENKKVDDNINIGIVPSTKLSGKKDPHPNCDGIGFRFNGPKGLESWKKTIERLKQANQKIKIYEFSFENFGLGDYHFPDKGNIFELIKNVDMMDYGILSDGGIHHAFNIRKKPVFIFQACLINKAEFFKLGNSLFPKHLHLECRKNCPSYYYEVFGGENLSLKCKKECENLSPELLADYILQNIK
jgi:hypothetical protein